MVLGNEPELRAQLIEDDKNKSIQWGINPPCMSGWNEEEESYEGPTINETIQVGDYLTYGYCDGANCSEVTLMTEKVIKVKAGTDGTGHHGSIIVIVDDLPRPISHATKIRRAKYLNESGILNEVPDDEGKWGYIEDFGKIITGDQYGGMEE